MRPSRSSTRLIAIVGGSGAGKGWLSAGLHRLLGENAARLSLDDFYQDRSALQPGLGEDINYDEPGAIDWDQAEQVLHDCQNGRATRVPRYDPITHRRVSAGDTWQPKPLVLIDGLWLLWRPAIRRLFDLKIYLDCPESLRLRRRLTRDVASRGRTDAGVRRQFRLTVAPMHRQYVAPQQQWADLVLSQPLKEAHVGQLANRFWALLQTGSPLPGWMRAAFSAELLNRPASRVSHD